MLSELNQKSLENAKQLLSNPAIKNIEIGTTAGLQQIHQALFDDLYDFGEQIRQQNISKDNFRFANMLYLP